MKMKRVMILGVILGLFLFSFSFVSGVEAEVISVIEKNSDTQTTDVEIKILANDNVIAINETFSSPLCYVSEHSLGEGEEIEIYEFNSRDNIWIFGDRSDSLDLTLTYSIDYDCDVVDEKYYLVDEDSLLSGDFDVDSGDVSPGDSSPGSGGPGGSSPGGGTQTTSENFISRDISKAESRDEFDDLVETARNFLGLDESKVLDKGIFYTILILAGLAVLIGVIVLIGFFRRPKDFSNVKKNV
jgi:hypothetical protein